MAIKGITPTFHRLLIRRLELQPLLHAEIIGLEELYERYEDLLAEMAELIEAYDRLRANALKQEVRLRHKNKVNLVGESLMIQ